MCLARYIRFVDSNLVARLCLSHDFVLNIESEEGAQIRPEAAAVPISSISGANACTLI